MRKDGGNPMEILSLLRLNGKRVVALSTLGAISGGLAATAVHKQPASYEANITVFVSQALPAGGNAFDIGPLVSDFQEALRLPQVRRTVADSLALPVEQVAVTATRNGADGGSVRVTSLANSPEQAEAIATNLSKGAMRSLGQQQVDRATALESQRQTEANTTRAARDKLLADNGFVDPGASYNDILAEANRLALVAADPTLQLAAEARAAAMTEAARLRAQLPVLRAKAEEYRLVQNKLQIAEDNLAAAGKERVAAEATLASATSQRVVSESETVTVSPVAKMVQGAAAAVAATFGAGIAFFMAVEARRNRRARRRGASAGAGGRRGKNPAKAPLPAEVGAAGNGTNASQPADETVAELLGDTLSDHADDLVVEEPVVEPAPRTSAVEPPVQADVVEDPAQVDVSLANDLVEVGAAHASAADRDSWGHGPSMFSKPARPLVGTGGEPRPDADGPGGTVVRAETVPVVSPGAEVRSSAERKAVNGEPRPGDRKTSGGPRRRRRG